MKKIPKITVGLPVYNGEQFVAQALDCLLAQTFKDFELIIADNASTDGTLEICTAYAQKDDRVRLLDSSENRGAAWNFNRVVEEAQAPYFTWAAHDDLRAPDYFERCIAALDENPGAVLCCTRTKEIDENANELRTIDFPMRTDASEAHVRFGDLVCINHHCVSVFGLIRTEVLRKTPVIASYVHSDRNLLAELALHGPFIEIPEYLFFRRDHVGRSVKTYRDERERLRWFDTRLRHRRSLPHWRRAWEYFASVHRAPISTWERVRCDIHVLRFMWQVKRRLVKDFLNA